MRKYIHPLLKETMIQTKDGALYFKRWLYFRSFLPLEVDYTINAQWKKPKKILSDPKLNSVFLKKIN